MAQINLFNDPTRGLQGSPSTGGEWYFESGPTVRYIDYSPYNNTNFVRDCTIADNAQLTIAGPQSEVLFIDTQN